MGLLGCFLGLYLQFYDDYCLLTRSLEKLFIQLVCICVFFAKITVFEAEAFVLLSDNVIA